jgi:uncharacterized protein YbaR (Trm112 family)
MTFDPEFALPLIVCPQSHAPFVHEAGTLVSTDPQTRLKYEIRDGIPILLVDEAQEVPQREWEATMQKHGRDPRTGTLLKPTNGQSE